MKNMNLDVETILEVKRLLDEGQEIFAIKKLRQNGLSFEEAKSYVSQFQASQVSSEVNDELDEKKINIEKPQSSPSKLKIKISQIGDAIALGVFSIITAVSYETTLITVLFLLAIAITFPILSSKFSDISRLLIGAVRLVVFLAVIFAFWLPRANLESGWVNGLVSEFASSDEFYKELTCDEAMANLAWASEPQFNLNMVLASGVQSRGVFGSKRYPKEGDYFLCSANFSVGSEDFGERLVRVEWIASMPTKPALYKLPVNHWQAFLVD